MTNALEYALEEAMKALCEVGLLLRYLLASTLEKIVGEVKINNKHGEDETRMRIQKTVR